MLTRPIRVAVLCSQRAPGLLDLVERDPERGRSYEIVGVVSSEPAFDGQMQLMANGVPTRNHAIREFYRRRGADIFRDFRTRAAFDRQTAGLLSQYAPDIILLDGYLYLATHALLDAFPNRVINLHFSDLTVRLPDGRPRYPGIRAVRDAILDGQPSTRATVHVVDEQPDGGPPLVQSWPFPVSPLAAEALALHAPEMFKAYVFAHQEWMIRAASGPLLDAALRQIAEGAVDLRTSDSNALVPWTVDKHGHISYRHAA